MPDILFVISRRWKLIVLITLLATGIALIACLIAPNQYLGTVTALPANSTLTDRGHIFNSHIEGLYPELGAPDELDKFEGTAKLDTIFLAVVKDFQLADHYGAREKGTMGVNEAVKQLRKKTTISRTGYGELKIEVWDKESEMAANLANALFHQLNAIHFSLAAANKQKVLQQLKKEYNWQKEKQDTANNSIDRETDNSVIPLTQYARLIQEYELSLNAAPNPLLLVEPARPSPLPDKPKTLQLVALAFLASLLTGFLLAVFLESRQSAK